MILEESNHTIAPAVNYSANTTSLMIVIYCFSAVAKFLSAECTGVLLNVKKPIVHFRCQSVSNFTIMVGVVSRVKKVTSTSRGIDLRSMRESVYTSVLAVFLFTHTLPFKTVGWHGRYRTFNVSVNGRADYQLSYTPMRGGKRGKHLPQGI